MIGFEDSQIRIFEKKYNNHTGGLLFKCPANINKGFHFDYCIFIPNGIDVQTSLLIQIPNYSASIKSTDVGERIDYIFEIFKGFKSHIHLCNNSSKFPILYPLIPRKWDDFKDEEIFTHMLSSNALFYDDEKFTRVDIQLIHMIHDAKERLRSNNINIDNKIIIEGFSAPAKFANRFTLLHPEIVKLCIAGGIGGCLTLPIRKIAEENLIYPVGIGNIKEITNEKIEEFKKVKQFYYQSIDDNIDAFISTTITSYIPANPGVIKEEELKQLYNLLGRDMLNKRLKKTINIYKKENVNATFKIYQSGGHSPMVAVEDITDLFLKEVRK